MEELYVKSTGEPISMELIGWYFGEPDDYSIKQFSDRKYKAIFDEEV